MKKTDESFPYPEEEYQRWKNVRTPEEDDSREAYIKWRIERDKYTEEFSKRVDKMFEESDEREKKMTPEERKALDAARRRHWEKSQIEEETNHALRKRDDDSKKNEKLE